MMLDKLHLIQEMLYLIKNVFQEKQHKITLVDRKNGKCLKHQFLHSNSQYDSLIENQPTGTDLYITKYPKNRLLQCIILDFDVPSHDLSQKHRVFREVKHLQRFLKKKGMNVVIVSSGNKGYHAYIQTAPHIFKNAGVFKHNKNFDYNLLFNNYVGNILNIDEIEYRYLDDINTQAGLDGNIRLMGSVHPSTGERCEIVKGEFIEDVGVCDWDYNAYKSSYYKTKVEIELELLKQYEFKNKSVKKSVVDLVAENDLRQIIPQTFGGEVKSFKKGYIMTQCFEHVDRNPSMVVTKDYYYCKSCGAKGNIYTLIDKGYIEREDMVDIDWAMIEEKIKL